MRVLRNLASGFVAVLTVAALVQPASAVQFTWNQNGGFLFPGAGVVDGSGGPPGTLMAGSFFGNTPPNPPNANHGGLEFSGVQGGNAPPNTYSLIQWGCVADGNNDTGVTNCVNGGVLANVTQNAENLPLPAAGRSALHLTVFDSAASGVLDSATQTPVVIARIDHLNRVIDNEANSLANIDVSARLIVNTTAGDVVDNNTVPISFLETRNFLDPDDCPGVNPVGSGCDDVFTFDTGEFANVPFTVGDEDFFLQFGIAPVPECDTPAGNIGTIQIFQCDDGHRIAIDFQNGLAWAPEGFDSGFLITMFVTEERINVPAPAALSLLGLGLAGLGVMAWRKGKKA